ncbi:MAG: hypothetical protein HY665_06535, partial [Chloroflexi bacterium]|nr:hypothetical protein [Chloroflexota bacterium]
MEKSEFVEFIEFAEEKDEPENDGERKPDEALSESLSDNGDVDSPVKPGNDITTLDEDLPKIEAFYRLALKRDQVLISNAFKKMEEDRQPISIIVTGGFHT